METEEDVSCPAIYRLRAKLRELMKGGQQVAKSDCDDLRAENDRLLAEIAELRHELSSPEEREVTMRMFQPKSVETTTVPEYIDVSELLQKLKDCEETVSELREQLAEKENLVNSLKKELEGTIDQKKLLDEIEAMKAELQKKDDKVLTKF